MGPWFDVEVAAFVVSATGHVLVANRAGTAWLDAPDHRELLTRRGGPDRTKFDVTPFAFGATTHYLAIQRPPEPLPDLESLATRWRLTPRESEVVTAILRGSTNNQIAGELGCAVKTVEHHVSSILRKANVDNRASLIVALLEPGP